MTEALIQKREEINRIFQDINLQIVPHKVPPSGEELRNRLADSIAGVLVGRKASAVHYLNKENGDKLVAALRENYGSQIKVETVARKVREGERYVDGYEIRISRVRSRAIVPNEPTEGMIAGLPKPRTLEPTPQVLPRFRDVVEVSAPSPNSASGRELIGYTIGELSSGVTREGTRIGKRLTPEMVIMLSRADRELAYDEAKRSIIDNAILQLRYNRGYSASGGRGLDAKTLDCSGFVATELAFYTVVHQPGLLSPSWLEKARVPHSFNTKEIQRILRGDPTYRASASFFNPNKVKRADADSVFGSLSTGDIINMRNPAGDKGHMVLVLYNDKEEGKLLLAESVDTSSPSRSGVRFTVREYGDFISYLRSKDFTDCAVIRLETGVQLFAQLTKETPPMV